MITKKIIHIATSFALLGSMLVPVLAFAESHGSATASATVATTLSSKQIKAMEAAKAKAYKEIDRRVSTLTDLNTRINEMQKVTEIFKNNLISNIQTHIEALTSLRVKIDTNTDLETLRADIKSINQSYRIYALIIPQSRILAHADRVMITTDMMTTLGIKLQALVASAQSAGADIGSMTTALSDLSVKISDAITQAQAAVSISAPLIPDNGDKAKKAENEKALQTAQKNLQTAQKDLVAARKNINIIEKALKVAQKNAMATTTTTTPAKRQ